MRRVKMIRDQKLPRLPHFNHLKMKLTFSGIARLLPCGTATTAVEIF